MHKSYRTIQLFTVAIISIAAFSSSQSFAKQYYKWVDSKGSTHYTTTPPPQNAKSKSKIDTYGAHQSTVATTPQTAPASDSNSVKAVIAQPSHSSNLPVQKATTESTDAPQAQ